MKKALLLAVVLGLVSLPIFAGCSTSINYYHLGGWWSTWANFNTGTGHVITYSWTTAGADGLASTYLDSGCQSWAAQVLEWAPDAYVSGDFGNNATCDTLLACPSTLNPIVWMEYNTVAEGTAAHSVRWLVDSVNYAAPAFNFDDSSSNGQTNAELPMLTWVADIDDVDGLAPYDISVTLQTPALSGIFGDGSIGAVTNAVAGIAIVYRQEAPGPNPPTTGDSGSWATIADANAWVPYSALGTQRTFTLSLPTTDDVWFSYIPVLSYLGGCGAPANCSAAEMQALFGAGFYTGFAAQNSDMPVAPTPVQFVSFHGAYQDIRTVDLTWETATEVDAQGFNLYRSLDGENWVKINAQLIPAEGSAGTGATYAYTDMVPKQRTYTRYQYMVEEITVNGQRAASMTTGVTK